LTSVPHRAKPLPFQISLFPLGVGVFRLFPGEWGQFSPGGVTGLRPPSFLRRYTEEARECVNAVFSFFCLARGRTSSSLFAASSIVPESRRATPTQHGSLLLEGLLHATEPPPLLSRTPTRFDRLLTFFLLHYSRCRLFFAEPPLRTPHTFPLARSVTVTYHPQPSPGPVSAWFSSPLSLLAGWLPLQDVRTSYSNTLVPSSHSLTRPCLHCPPTSLKIPPFSCDSAPFPTLD